MRVRTSGNRGWIGALLLALALAGAAHADRSKAPATQHAKGKMGGTGDLAQPREAAGGPEGEEPAVPSNFDSASGIMVSHESGPPGAIPQSAAPDVVGAFRFLCMAGQLRFDDPILYPGKPGQSHLHQFFGNTAADANSTYASLRRSGDSTCMNRLNRSAYWMPAMLNGRGQVIRPDFVSIYYKRRPNTDPECNRVRAACVALPRGLRFVFGFDMVHPDAPATGSHYYNCQGPGATEGHYETLVEVAKVCPSGAQLGAIINAPSCWDGKRLDSPDHREHVAYPQWTGGKEHCPFTHPVVIPTFTMGSWYTVDATLDRSGTWDGARPTWHLSSDEMPGANGAMRVPGTTFHADWFGAWDDATLRQWTENCLDKLLNCHGGDLGNGKQLRQVTPFAWLAKPHAVPVPDRPVAAPGADPHAGMAGMAHATTLR
jgi:hypothetical protein